MPSNPNSLLGRVFPTCRRLVLEYDVKRFGPIDGKMLVVGSGHNPYRLWSEQVTVTTLDIESNNGEVDIVADAHKMPIDDGQFETVLAVEVIEHLYSPSQFISEVSRILKPKGEFVFTIPFLFPIHGDPNDYQRYTASGIKELLRDYEIAELRSQGNRIHVISDLITTVKIGRFPIFIFARVLNHFLKFVKSNSDSKSPTGYYVRAVKKGNRDKQT